MSASFWKLFGIGVVSTIDTLLQREDVTLEQLLAEDELLNECKYANKSLLQFVLRPEIMNRLFELLTTAPPAEADPKVQRYPQICSEILCTDGWWDFFSPHIFNDHPNLVTQLWSFFLQEGPFSTSNVAAVSRVAGTFFERLPLKSFELMPRETLIDALLKHCEQLAVVELLLKIDIAGQSPEFEDIKDWLESQNLLSKLLGKLDPQNSTILERETIADILLEHLGRQDSYLLIGRLQSPEVFATLFDFILNGSSTVTDLLPVFSLIIGLLKQENPDLYDSTTTLEELPAYMTKILAGTTKFSELLQVETPKLTLAHQKEVATIGHSKLKVVELVYSIIRLRRKVVLSELISAGLIGACLDLFFLQPWNNFMHKTVLDILYSILTNGDASINTILIEKTDLLTRIGDAAAGHEEDIKQEKHIQRGYMGHLAILSETLLAEAEKDEALLELMKNNASFIRYLNTVLYPTQKRQHCWQTLPGLPDKYITSVDFFETTIPHVLIDPAQLVQPETSFTLGSAHNTDSDTDDHTRFAPAIINQLHHDNEQDDEDAPYDEQEDSGDSDDSNSQEDEDVDQHDDADHQDEQDHSYDSDDSSDDSQQHHDEQHQNQHGDAQEHSNDANQHDDGPEECPKDGSLDQSE